MNNEILAILTFHQPIYLQLTNEHLYNEFLLRECG